VAKASEAIKWQLKATNILQKNLPVATAKEKGFFK